MRTSKPIATISYNSEDFLKARLQELLRNHRIDDYMYIKHDPEEDENKAHIHLWISPNRLLDTMDLQDFFVEPDPKHPDKPFKCLPFSVSKVDDWVLYGMHLPAYLMSKGQTREFVYEKKDFKYADEDTFERTFRHALHGSEWAHRNQILNLVVAGLCDPLELITSGIVPMSMANQLSAMVSMQGKTFRGSYSGHEEPIPDKEAERKNAEEAKKAVKARKQAKRKVEAEAEAKAENPFE